MAFLFKVFFLIKKGTLLFKSISISILAKIVAASNGYVVVYLNSYYVLIEKLTLSALTRTFRLIVFKDLVFIIILRLFSSFKDKTNNFNGILRFYCLAPRLNFKV